MRNNLTDSLVQSIGNIHGRWSNGTVNLNFRRQFDSSGRELTADADYIYYKSSSNQLFQNYTYDPDMNLLASNTLSGDLPSTINIYSFKTDYTHPFRNEFKLEAGLKTSFVSTDNKANYYDVAGKPIFPIQPRQIILYITKISMRHISI